MPVKQDIPSLTGLRGAAALWVAAYHLLLPAGFVTGTTAAMLGRGYLAVDLFFVLSGFVMALTYAASFKSHFDRTILAGFLLRRFARLYPLYGLILVLRFSYTAWRYGSFNLPRPWIAAPMLDPALSIPANLLLVQAWGIAGSSIGTAWSISAEWGAYFVFPILASLVLRPGTRAAVAMAACAVSLIAGVAVIDAASGYHAGLLDAWDGRSAGPIMRCLGGFTIGIVLWRMSLNQAVSGVAGAWQTRLAVFTSLAACLAAGAPDLVVYPLFPAIVLCLACSRGRSSFAHPWLIWLGEISYALYLLHIFLLHPLDVTRMASRAILPPAVADIAAPVIIFAILLAASHLTYQRIEKPGRALIMRLGKRLVRPHPVDPRQAGSQPGEPRQAEPIMATLTSNT